MNAGQWVAMAIMIGFLYGAWSEIIKEPEEPPMGTVMPPIKADSITPTNNRFIYLECVQVEITGEFG